MREEIFYLLSYYVLSPGLRFLFMSSCYNILICHSDSLCLFHLRSILLPPLNTLIGVKGVSSDTFNLVMKFVANSCKKEEGKTKQFC